MWYLPVLIWIDKYRVPNAAGVVVNLAVIDIVMPITILDEGAPGFSELKDTEDQ